MFTTEAIRVRGKRAVIGTIQWEMQECREIKRECWVKILEGYMLKK